MLPAARLAVTVASLDATHAVAGALARLSRPGDTIVLAGEMGAGKTAFAQGFGRALGVDEPITSPTFTLVHTYTTASVTLHHADIYRLDQMAEVADLALSEMADHGIVLVEWGDVVASAIGDHLEVRLDPAGTEPGDGADEPPTSRRITITADGRAWATRWAAVTRSLADLSEAAPC